jgi:hypothetical protein
VDWIVRDLLRGAAPGAVPDHTPPPHLTNAYWRFVCSCGYRWQTPQVDADGQPLPGRDAEWRDDAWRSPRAECLNCHAWPEGRTLATPS